MFPTIQIGPLSVQTSGLFILVALWLGLNLSEKYAVKHGYPADKLYTLVFVTLIAGLTGARLSFILSNYSAFSGNLIEVFSMNPALLDSLGGFVAAILAGLIYSQKNKLPAWETFDALTPLLAVLMVGNGLSHLATGNVYGSETGMPWGINLWGAKRHLTQIYEILAGLATLTIVWWYSLRTNIPGALFLVFLIITSIWIIFIEGFRGDSRVFLAGIRTNQIIALMILCYALFVTEKRIAQKSLSVQP
jgi:phosphatidylglycerol---prolipoprotein diacylglyceryl transferase